MSLISMPKYISIGFIIKIISMKVAVLSATPVGFVIVCNEECDRIEVKNGKILYYFLSLINIY